MNLQVGQALPELSIDVTPTFVISTALATRDFQDVHHDRDKAVARGGQDIFVNILTSTGLVQRFVTDWAGPRALVRKVAIRLGVPCYAGDTLTFSGRVAGCDPGGDYLIEVTGRCRLGDHVTGTVRVVLPADGDHADGDHAGGDHAGGDHAGGDHAGGDHAGGDHAGGGRAGGGQGSGA